MLGEGQTASLGAREAIATGTEFALQVVLAGLAPLELARRSLGQAARGQTNDVDDRDAQLLPDLGADGLDHGLLVVGARFSDDHDLFAGLAGDAECDDVAPPHAVQFRHAPFERLGMQVAAVDDDEVFDPARDDDLAVADVAEVACAKEPVGPVSLGGRLGVLEIAKRDRRALEAKLPFATVGQPLPIGAEDPDLVPAEGGATSDVFGRQLAVDRVANGAVGLEGLRVDNKAFPSVRAPLNRHRQRGFGHAVGGRDRIRRHLATRGEQVREGANRGWLNGLGAAADHCEAAEVPVREVLVANAFRGERKGEVRRERHSAAVAVDGVEPNAWAFDEAQRRDEHGGDAVEDGGDDEADEAHVMVERQPTDGLVAVARHHLQGFVDDAPRVGHQARVRDHDALRVRGGPRRVLKEGQVGGNDGLPGGGRVACPERGGGDDLLQGGHPVSEAPENREQALAGDEERRAGLREDALVAVDVGVEARKGHRRVEWDRNDSGAQGCEEGEDEVLGLDDDEADPVALAQAVRLQRGSTDTRFPGDVGEEVLRLISLEILEHETAVGGVPANFGNGLGDSLEGRRHGGSGVRGGRRTLGCCWRPRKCEKRGREHDSARIHFRPAGQFGMHRTPSLGRWTCPSDVQVQARVRSMKASWAPTGPRNGRARQPRCGRANGASPCWPKGQFRCRRRDPRSRD